MKFLRVEKNIAYLVMGSAALGLVFSNLGLLPFITALGDLALHIDLLGIDFSLRKWIEDFLLVGFFFLVGLELKREFTSGSLKRPVRVVVPALAAVFGVIVPALVFLLINISNPESLRGWPIPTATDLTFGLAVFVIFGSKLPRGARTFLLAFAVIDDILAILIIAVVFGEQLSLTWLGVAILLGFFFWFSYRVSFPVWAQIVLAVLVWYATLKSGIHPTVSGVALALLIPTKKLEKLELQLHPIIGAAVLPLFAFFATSVSLSSLPEALNSSVFWGIAIRPLSKFVGISAGVLIAWLVLGKRRDSTMKLVDYLVVATVGGIGFTVSLLIANLTWPTGNTNATAASVATIFSAVLSVGIAALAFRARTKYLANPKLSLTAQSTES